MLPDTDDDAARFCAALTSNVRDEMRKQLQRNPSADRRRILDMALRFQQEKLTKIADRWEASGDVDSSEVIREAGRIALEEVGNEVRATF